MKLLEKFEDIRTKISAVAAEASESDRREVDQIITQAKVGDYQAEKATMTPGMAALLFLNHNPYNRDWKGAWSVELLRRIESSEWRANGDPVRFYKEGVLADAQNRLAAIALGGKVLDVIIVYGIEREAILTIDGGKPRYASDAAKLDGIESAAEKERIVKIASSYLVRAGKRNEQLHSEVEVSREMRTHNRDLDTAISIAESISEGIVAPRLKRLEAATVAFLLMRGKWPIATIKEKLKVFQTGLSEEGSDDPFYVAGKLIEKSRQALNKRDKLTTARQLGMVIYAMVQAEKGIKAISSSRFRDAVKTESPSFAYPIGNDESAAA